MRKNSVFLAGLASLALALGLAGCPGVGPEEDPVEFTVSFHANGGVVSPISVKVEEGGTVTTPTPTNTTPGSTVFQGWYTENGISSGVWGSRFTDATPVTADIMLHARWGALALTTYTVTFNSQGGSAVSSITVNNGDTLGTLPAAPTKTGNTFGGWFTGENGGGTQFTGTTAVTDNITVFAKWTAQTPPGGGSGKTLIITGLGGVVDGIPTGYSIIAALFGEEKNPVAGGVMAKSSISGGSLTFNLKTANGAGDGFTTANWTGSGSYNVVLYLTGDGTFDGIDKERGTMETSDPVTFSSTTTTVAMSQFAPSAEGGSGPGEEPGPGGGPEPGPAIAKRLTVTGLSGVVSQIPSGHSIFVALSGQDGSGVAGAIVAKSSISGDSYAFTLKTVNPAGDGITTANWTGSGSFYVAWFTTSDGTIAGMESFRSIPEPVNFSSATTTVAWNQFQEGLPGMGDPEPGTDLPAAVMKTQLTIMEIDSFISQLDPEEEIKVYLVDGIDEEGPPVANASAIKSSAAGGSLTFVFDSAYQNSFYVLCQSAGQYYYITKERVAFSDVETKINWNEFQIDENW
jgi:uncharacterized repeat protein (TIGR02543 family)